MFRRTFILFMIVWLVALLAITFNRSTAQDNCTLCIDIPNGVNIRSLESDTFGQVDASFPRTEVEVIGWFDAASTPLGAIGDGIWLVLITEDGELRAVKADLVLSGNDTALAAETVEEYAYDGSEFLPASEIPTPTPVPSPTPMPTMNPDDIVFPDVPEELTFRLPYWDTAASEMAYADPETITVKQDQLLPIPIGFIEGDEAPILSLLAQMDSNEEFDGNALPIYLSGIVMSIDLEPSVPNGQKITLQTQTPGGNWFTVSVDIQNYIRTIAVDDAMNQVDPPIKDNFIDLRMAFSEDKITTDNVTIVPGDMIVLRIWDADHFDPKTLTSILPRSIEMDYGITTGLDGFLSAIDKGELDPAAEVSLSPIISYEQMVMAHE